jgi:hypothetical protein
MGDKMEHVDSEVYGQLANVCCLPSLARQGENIYLLIPPAPPGGEGDLTE